MTPAAVERRIFVVGVPRSGTTLVQSLLAAHPDLTSFTESHFFDRHFRMLPIFGPILTRDPSRRLEAFLVENHATARSADRLFGATRGRWRRLRPLLPAQTLAVARRLLRELDDLALERGVSAWVEKTPSHLRFFRLIERASGPEMSTSFVHVVRDGLEVVSSLHTASRHWQRPYRLRECARRWNHEVGLSLAMAGRPGHHVIVYESLTAEPEATLRPLVDSLGITWRSEILDGYPGASRRLVTSEETWKAGVDRRIRPSATSGHALSAEQRTRVTGLLRQDLYRQAVEQAETRGSR
jgi:hypothetical protein